MGRPLVRVVGLGPGGPDLVTRGTLDAIAAAPHRYLRTVRHPAAEVMAGAASFDHLYDSASTIDEVYPRIVEGTNAKAASDSSFAKISDPDMIEVGQKLWIPPKPAD